MNIYIDYNYASLLMKAGVDIIVINVSKEDKV